MSTATIDRLTCDHGMPTPAACVDCMDEGKYVPTQARRARTGQHGIGGYALDNDCSVQAIVNAIGVTYAEAAEALRSAGWIPGRGATTTQIAEAVRTLGLTMTPTALDLAAAVRDGGTYIVLGWRGRKGHAWVIEAGEHLNPAGYHRPGRQTMRYVVAAIEA